MPSNITTAGKILVDQALPKEYKGRDFVFDKKGLGAFFQELAVNQPEQYVDVMERLMRIAENASTEYGGTASISLKDLEIPPEIALHREKLRKDVARIAQNPRLSMQQKNEKILEYMKDQIEPTHENLKETALKYDNAFAKAIKYGYRGSGPQLTQILYGDLLVADHKGRPVPVPGLHGYGEGVEPIEYWGGSYGSRKGFCLDAETDIRTPFGKIKITKVEAGKTIVLGCSETGEITGTVVKQLFKNGRKPIFRYTFKLLTEDTQEEQTQLIYLDCTEEHKILAFDFVTQFYKKCAIDKLTPFITLVPVYLNNEVLRTCILAEKMFLGYRETYDIEVEHADHLFVVDKGLIVSNSDVQFATAQTGYFGKRLSLMTHRVRVTGKDCGAENIGLLRTGEDPDNIGAVLAKKVGRFEPGTIISKEMLPALQDKTILLRSAATCQQPEGICQKCAGVRETGKFADIGDFIGIHAARVISEPLTQLGLCLSADTQVLMASGDCKAIKDVLPGDAVFSVDDAGNKFKTYVKRVYLNGTKECIKYLCKKGRKEIFEIICTPDHKFWTGKEWLPIADIEKFEQAVALPLGNFDDTGYVYEKFALLLGLLLGDGCYTKAVGTVNYSCADLLLIEELRSYLEELNLKMTKLKGHDYYYKVATLKEPKHPRNSKGQFFSEGYVNPARVFLRDNGCLHRYSYEKCLPPVVFTWNNLAIQELIAGLIITDGSVHFSQNCVKVSFGSTSKKLVEQLKQLLLVRFGITTGNISINNYGDRKRNLYSITIATYDSLKKFDTYIYPYLKGIKKQTWKNLFDLHKQVKIQNKYFEKNTAICPAVHFSIISKTPMGSLMTYDLEIDHETHNFLLESGLCTKNSSKHTGGAVGAKNELSGFEEIEQFADVPENFIGKAILAPKDGKIQKIVKAPQGGHYMFVDGEQIYVPQDRTLSAKIGDEVEAGDTLSDGTPNPAEIAMYKGIGEGRKYFVDKFTSMLKEKGVAIHQRNTEAVARAFFDKVRITSPDGVMGYEIGEKVPYTDIQREYEPREGSEILRPSSLARNKYLERPVLHYSIGTRLTPKVLQTLKDTGIDSVTVHKDPPGFEPEVVRLMDIPSSDPDWKVRMAGFGLKASLLDAATHGSSSPNKPVSYIPGLMDVEKL